MIFPGFSGGSSPGLWHFPANSYTVGGVNPLHRHYTGLTHTYCVGLVEKHCQKVLIHYTDTNCDTYPLTAVKMKFLFSTCEKRLGFTVPCLLTHT